MHDDNDRLVITRANCSWPGVPCACPQQLQLPAGPAGVGAGVQLVPAGAPPDRGGPLRRHHPPPPIPEPRHQDQVSRVLQFWHLSTLIYTYKILLKPFLVESAY